MFKQWIGGEGRKGQNEQALNIQTICKYLLQRISVWAFLKMEMLKSSQTNKETV